MTYKVKGYHALTSVKRERVLSVPGNVLVRRMQKVSPTDVIVVAPMAPEYLLLDIARGLNVTPERADELLQRGAGEDLAKGDVIAGPVGMLQRVIRAPQNGLIKIAGEGKVLFEITSAPYELQAGMDGMVTNVIPERGAIIESRGALIQGVWGNGKITYGVIQQVSNDLLQELIPEQMNISFRGTIITAGFVRNPEVLEVAGSIPIKGMILGSMSSALIPAAKRADYPIMLVDGFGSFPMNRAAQSILTANKDKNVALNAQKYDSFQGNYPEVIISQSTTKDLADPKETETLRVGKQVIIINGPLTARIGKIESILPEKRTLPSGITTAVAEVSLSSEERTEVPLTNLEIITTHDS
jgi:transcription antitermination factor NusG